jgi:hypothetical protein
VPDGTTAQVRCPACRTIFSPEQGAGPEAPAALPAAVPVAPPPRPAPLPAARPLPVAKALPARPAGPAGPERPRPRPSRRDDEDDRREPESEYPEYDEEREDRPRKRRRPEENDGLTPEERAARNAAFQRGMWGCKLLWMSLLLYALSLMLIGLYFIVASIAEPEQAFIVLAGVLGLVNWVLGAVGIGLCLAGPQSVGHYRYGISAAVAAAAHAIFLIAVFATPAEPFTVERDVARDDSTLKWWQLPTRLDQLTLYMTYLAYPDDTSRGYQQRSRLILAVVTGVVEMIRLVFAMMLLSCLARAAGDERLSHRCTRAAGVAAFAPGAIALGLLCVFAILIETNAQGTTFGKVLLSVALLAVYMLIAGMLIPALSASRDTAEACEFPFQSQNVDLGA